MRGFTFGVIGGAIGIALAKSGISSLEALLYIFCALLVVILIRIFMGGY